MKGKFAALALTTLLCLTASLAGCKKDNTTPSYGRRYFRMGTDAVMFGAKIKKSNFNGVADEVGALLTEAENSLSASLATSYIYKFNEAAPGEKVQLDKTAYDVLTVAKRVYIATQGAYNPAVYYSCDLYGFAVRGKNTPVKPYDRVQSADGSYPLPEGKYVAAFSELASHFAEVELFEENGAYYAVKPTFTVSVEGDESVYSIKLDLGGVGKGWCADKVGEVMQSRGLDYGYFNFGSSSMAVKNSAFADDKKYPLSARDPRSAAGDSYVSMSVGCENLSTSGDYENWYELEGRRYCHIIDPATGSPIDTGVASVTVIGGNAAEDDALTTALSVMGKQKAVEYINANLTSYRVIMLIFEGGEGKIITNCPQDIKILNKNYKLANTVEGGRIVLN